MRSIANEAVRQFVSRKVLGGWKLLGRELGFKDAVMSNIEVEVTQPDHQNPSYEKCYQMLLEWKQRLGNDATVKVLLTKLTKCHSGDIARALIKKLSIDDNGKLELSS